MQMDRNALDVAWAAGLFEGEGCITPRGKTSGEIVIGMTDRDILERVQAVFGVGGITSEERRPPHKTCHRWSVSNAADCTMVLEAMLPWFGARRRAVAGALVERMKACRGAHIDKTHCVNGHPYNAENTYITPAGHRRCKTCHRVRVAESTARTKAQAPCP